jgi:hypothetical protein
MTDEHIVINLSCFKQQKQKLLIDSGAEMNIIKVAPL